MSLSDYSNIDNWLLQVSLPSRQETSFLVQQSFQAVALGDEDLDHNVFMVIMLYLVQRRAGDMRDGHACWPGQPIEVFRFIVCSVLLAINSRQPWSATTYSWCHLHLYYFGFCYEWDLQSDDCVFVDLLQESKANYRWTTLTKQILHSVNSQSHHLTAKSHKTHENKDSVIPSLLTFRYAT